MIKNERNPGVHSGAYCLKSDAFKETIDNKLPEFC